MVCCQGEEQTRQQLQANWSPLSIQIAWKTVPEFQRAEVESNARSLVPKMDELKLPCATYEPTAVCIVETWLSDDIPDAEISLFNYSVIRLDRYRRGGGIAIYVGSNIVVETLLHDPSDLEFM